jgi:dCMP deaminase
MCRTSTEYHQKDISQEVEGVLQIDSHIVVDRIAKQVKIDRVRLKQANEESKLSSCVKHAVGCIITDVFGKIVSTGYNGTPAGHENCCDKFPNFDEQVATIKKEILSVETINRDDFNRVNVMMLETAQNNLEKLMKEHHEWSATHEIHAEANAIMHSSPEKRMGGTLYVNLQPCQHCAKLIAGSGVSRVVFGKMYARTDDTKTEKLFKDVGIHYIYIPNFLE